MSTNSAQLAMVDDIGRFLAHMPMKGDAAVSVLKGHLLVEEMLWSIVRANVRVPAALETTRFGFEQALCLARALAGDNNESWEYAATKRLNQLRNQLAHRLEPKDIDAKLQEFVAFVGSASPRKATAEAVALAGELHWYIAVLYMALSARLHYKPSWFV